MKSYLYLLCCALLLSCSNSDKVEIEPRSPNISGIVGTYLGTLQHDVFKKNTGIYEVGDTTYKVDGFKTIVTYENQEVTLKFPISGDYILPELKYKVKRIEESFSLTDVYIELFTTDEYRMRAKTNQVVFPAFRIWDGTGSINGSSGVELNIFLRSQDPDSVYNIIIQGRQ
ncbi:hypothetical protein JYB62_15215 [Algoriphagus lutimaris]|uniref:hypothetical protein n=1 Tax=Algoriphagus lutimaris TaxID=613197 RepID=UPI00196A3313|nr:hypothetical protein [Algoriphagus lutimaris]MBN3521359.1 hypothetical protein [Algoriphagus lutimaris]